MSCSGCDFFVARQHSLSRFAPPHSTTRDYLRDADNLLQLAVRVLKIMGASKEWFFYDQTAIVEDSFRLTQLVEQCRRIWWGFFAMDRQISILYDREPMLELKGCQVGFPLTNPEYEHQIEAQEAKMIAVTHPNPLMGGVIDAWGAMNSVVISCTPPTWFTPPKLPSLGAEEPPLPVAGASLDDSNTLRPTRSPRPFHPFEYYIDLMNLFEAIRKERPFALVQGRKIWMESPALRQISDDLDDWYKGLPKPVQLMDIDPSSTEYLKAPGSLQTLGIAWVSELGWAFRGVPSNSTKFFLSSQTDTAFLCSTRHVSLSAAIGSLQAGPEWTASPAFTRGLEHSLKSRQLHGFDSCLTISRPAMRPMWLPG